MSSLTLAELAPLRCWTAWQTALREDKGAPTKIPYRSTRGKAMPNNRATWLTLEEADIVAAGLEKPFGAGGIGLWLGELDGYAGLALGGIDLDTCIGAADGLAAWAAALMDILPTYCEVSPSGNGAKLFFLYRIADGLAIRQTLGISPKSNGEPGTGRKWSAGGVKDHPAGIEIYLSDRFFAVTRERMSEAADMTTLIATELDGAINAALDLLPGYRDKPQPVASVGALAPAERANAGLVPVPGSASVLDAIARSEPLARLWRGDLSDLPERDRSRSTAGFRMVSIMKGYGVPEADMHAAMAAHPVVGGWIAEKAQIGMRDWERAMERSSAIVPPDAGLTELPVVTGFSSSDDPPVRAGGGLPLVDGLSSSDPKPEGADFPMPLPAYSDSMIAERVIDLQDGNMRYVVEHGKWLLWHNNVWQHDVTLEATRRVEAVCRDVARQPAHMKLAASILSAKTIRAVEGLARANVRAASTTSEWDADPWLLNTPGGALDLRNGVLRAAERGDLATRQTTVTPDLKSECPMWRSFLRTITGGDGDLEAYLARVAGYCLTGITSEHALFFLHGTGRNGKGTFSHTLRKMLGSYAVAAESQTFAASQGNQHTTELARLDGARLVVTSETEEGKEWNESRIKQLTGGDPVTARFMRQDNFTFMPRFKLVMLGNHKPRLKAVDEAMRARINMLPFTVFVPPGERKKDLDDVMLAAEGGAILAWAVRGCMAWQNGGLQPPAAVMSATDSYVEAQDIRTAWFNELCQDMRGAPDEGMRATRLAELFASWRMWSEKANIKPGDLVAFEDWMKRQGFIRGANPLRQVTYGGVRLTAPGLTQPIDNVASSGGFAAPRSDNIVVPFPSGDKPRGK
jgi:P4 family phage/plasmid primase-like protien